MNLIQILFCLMTAVMIIYSSIINLLESKLPHDLIQLFRYGKFSAVSKSNLIIEVPKSWFKHFYSVAFLEYSYLLWLVTMVYVCDMKVPDHVKYFLDFVCGKERYSYTFKHQVFIAVILMTLQVYRRFYDTHKVSVFGSRSKMNLSHYAVGHVHYPGTILAILCEAPLFTNAPAEFRDAPLNLLATSWSDIGAIIMFLFAWWHQFKCNKILADLRKNKKGEIVSSDYKLPKGDWFEYLTCPHQTTEILMYSSIMWILWNNVTWFFIFTWVLANQIETILLSHWWYKEKFEDFPSKRKALIPFVY
ncbi:unnamed protein product [Ceutorhynchus assimilis]|uniref:Polyprenal reductase n=1 Tax=Ceutorhynchus assimilis TaxID=467358 RepID=A0A9N9QFC7_9CUCU|nr:unnamed protein product [Ceutorhynchus assimilis]